MSPVRLGSYVAALLAVALSLSCSKAQPSLWTVEYYSEGGYNGGVDYSAACSHSIAYLLSIGSLHAVIVPLAPNSLPGWSKGEELTGVLVGGATTSIHDVSTGRDYQVRVAYVTRDRDTATAKTDAECK